MVQSASRLRRFMGRVFEGFFGLLDTLEMLAYILLGTALFVGFAYIVGRAVWSVGSLFLTVAFSALVLITLGLCIYDVYKRRFSAVSYALVGTWLLSVATVIVAEIFM